VSGDAIYQEIVENALAGTQAPIVALTRLDPASLEVETLAWAARDRASIARAATMAAAAAPGRVNGRLIVRADANEWLRRGYLAGEPFSAPLSEVAAGLVDDEVTRIVASVVGLRHCFQCPMLIEGRVEGAIVLVTRAAPGPAARRFVVAFARQAALTLERARRLDRVRQAQAELEAVLDATDDAVVVVGQDDRLLRVNRSARAVMVDLIGYQVDTLAEFNRLVRSATPDDGDSSQPGVIPRALLGEVGSRLLILAGQGGQQRRMHVHAAPVRDAGGRVVAAMVVARDLTALHDALVERGRLDGAIKTARLVAHQLNNQLSLLTGYGELLAEEGEGETAEFARGIVRGARSSAETIARLQRIIRFEEVDGGANYPMLDLDASTLPEDEPAAEQ
jgi:PAS domain S-box-containing protein